VDRLDGGSVAGGSKVKCLPESRIASSESSGWSSLPSDVLYCAFEEANTMSWRCDGSANDVAMQVEHRASRWHLVMVVYCTELIWSCFMTVNFISIDQIPFYSNLPSSFIVELTNKRVLHITILRVGHAGASGKLPYRCELYTSSEHSFVDTSSWMMFHMSMTS